MRKKASVLVALLAAIAVFIPAGAASAATNPTLSQIINAGTLSVDIVDGSGIAVASPSVAFPATNYSFSCQPSVATLGTGTQKIAVKNPLAGGVKVDLNAVTPATDKWTSGGDNYSYNVAAGAGCTSGQLAVSAGTFTKTVGAGTPVKTLPGGAFVGASPVTLLNNTGTVRYEAELTGYTLTQQIPAEQPQGTYSLPMNVSYIAQ